MKRKTTEIPDLNKLDDGALVTGKVAQCYFGISRTTRYRREKAGQFPQSRKVGGTARYVMGELRKQARDDAIAGVRA